jgi:5'-deoxy-5'-methylthioadenosine phosphorylase
MSTDSGLLGVIGGSGLCSIDGLKVEAHLEFETPYGAPSAALMRGRLGGLSLLFLPRHGTSHSIAPHRINYRANLWALHAAGVRAVVAVSTVGGIHPRMTEGSLVLPDQIIDYTWGRESSYFDGLSSPLRHVDFTRPFSAALGARLSQAAARAGVGLIDGGVYGATQGPRLETAAEIVRMARDGADLVGMTGMPEAVLARELGIDYAMLAAVVNAAAGCGNNREVVSIGCIEQVSARVMRDAVRVLSVLEGNNGN